MLNVRAFTRLQRVLIDEPTVDTKVNLFNNIEYGFNFNLVFPNFLLPIRQERFPKFYEPATSFSLGYAAQDRPTYNRFIINASVNYAWRASEYSKHSIFPLEINSIKVKGIPSAILDTLDPRTRVQFSNHLILDTRYTYIYNTQSLSKPRDFFYIKTSIETSGLLVNIIHQLTNAEKNSNNKYRLFGLEYSQYLRGDIDFTYYHYIDPKDILVFRAYLGIGYPYSNSEALPYEKAFVAGGANGMRGWGYRELGPGAYQGTINPIDRIGDMQIESNFEYRFPIYGDLNGALFTDIGNIWLVRKSSTYPKGDFRFDTMFEELAWDAGLGFRYDFKVINVRLDAAVRLRDPAKPRPNRWVVDQISLRRIFWNFAIGLPF